MRALRGRLILVGSKEGTLLSVFYGIQCDMDNGLTRDQMIHIVACNVLLETEAFSYLLPRIYFLSVSFGCVHVSSFRLLPHCC